MSDVKELKDFKESHPWPDEAGIEALYKFYRINPNHPEYLEHLLVNGKLHHSRPGVFNDPFECRPNFSWPKSPQNIKKIRDHLFKVARREGLNRKESERIVSKHMSNSESIKEVIYGAIQKTFSDLRICCFTTKKENLLFWSHYAGIHEGFCVQFDSSTMPISYAYKVKYSNEYPEVEYPSPEDGRAFIPALTKSEDWSYEEEFRTIFVPESINQPANDGESLLLEGHEITDIFFGAKMSEENVNLVLDLLKKGPFSPSLWRASFSSGSYNLEFRKYAQ